MRLTFKEKQEFYDKLDKRLESGKVKILFKNELPNEKSKLWPRLRKCKNWNVIENELNKIKDGNESKMKNMLSKSMVTALTGGELILIAWIVTLLAGLLFYGVYKNCKIKMKSSPEGDVELEIEPS